MTNNYDMTAQELETLLTERVNTFDLKKEAFDTLHQILSEDPDELIGGFARHEITFLFDGYRFLIDNRYSGPIMRARIGMYVENDIFLDHLELIGYYELEAGLDGEILDDWFVIEEEKYLKDIGIISHFQHMNEKLPLQYLTKNHVHYEFVSSVSLIGTLFMSKDFQDAGIFIDKAKAYLKTTDQSLFDKEYLKRAKKFLKMMSAYLIENNLITEELKIKLTESIKND